MRLTREELERLVSDQVSRALSGLVETGPSPIKRAMEASGPAADIPPGYSFARFVLAYARGGGDVQRARGEAEALWGTGNHVALSMSTTSVESGGALVPVEYAGELIEFLRPINAILRFNPRRIGMKHGNLVLGRLAGGAVAHYGGEGTPTEEGSGTTDKITLTARPLRCIVPLSNQLINWAVGVEDLVIKDAVGAINQAMDTAFIRGDGTGDTPKGIRHWAHADGVFASAGTTLADVDTDLRKAMYALRKGNVSMDSLGWLMSPRSEMHLKSLRMGAAGDGEYAFRQEMDAGKLLGAPYAVTNNIPENLGAGGDESEVYLVNFSDVIVGEGTGIRIKISEEGTYVRGGQLRSAFANDETVIRIVMENDICLRHERSAAVITGVTWGV